MDGKELLALLQSRVRNPGQVIRDVFNPNVRDEKTVKKQRTRRMAFALHDTLHNWYRRPTIHKTAEASAQPAILSGYARQRHINLRDGNIFEREESRGRQWVTHLTVGKDDSIARP